MLIQFNNWDISVKQDRPVVQGDNLSELLTVAGELPGGYDTWSLLMRVGSEENIITLGEIDGKPGIYLTGDMLPYGKVFYEVQLRGECGDAVKHSNVAHVYVSPLIAGDGAWPEVPTEFSQSEALIRELNAHPPIPDADGGYWDIWDAENHEYVVSEYPLPGFEGGEAEYDASDEELTLSGVDTASDPDAMELKKLNGYGIKDESARNALSGKADKSAQNVNGLDCGVAGDGVTDDTAAIQALLNTGSRTVYLPDRIYKTSSTLVVGQKNTRFICDGTINYGGTGAAVAVRRDRCEVVINAIYATYGTALEVGNSASYAVTHNKFSVNKITAGVYGVHLYCPNGARSVSYCDFRLGEVIAGTGGIFAECAETTAYISETNWWVRGISGNGFGVKLWSADGCSVTGGCGVNNAVFHSLALNNLHGSTGVIFHRTAGHKFHRHRFSLSENSGMTCAYAFEGLCREIRLENHSDIPLTGIDISTLDSSSDCIELYAAVNGAAHREYPVIINGVCGISYRPRARLGDREVDTAKFPGLTIGMLTASGYERAIATGFTFGSDTLSGQTVTMGRIYADFIRSLAAGVPVTLKFSQTATKTPAYVKDYLGGTVLDNSDGKYNGHTVVIRCVENYRSGGADVCKWAVSVEDDDAVRVRQALGGKQDALTAGAGIAISGGVISCTFADGNGVSY